MLEFTVMYFTLVGGGGGGADTVNVQYQQLLAKVGVVEVGPCTDCRYVWALSINLSMESRISVVLALGLTPAVLTVDIVGWSWHPGCLYW